MKRFLVLAVCCLTFASMALAATAVGSAGFDFTSPTRDGGALSANSIFTINGIVVPNAANNGVALGSFECTGSNPDEICQDDPGTVSSPFSGNAIDSLVGLTFTFMGGGIADRYEYTVTSSTKAVVTVIGPTTFWNLSTTGTFHDNAGTFTPDAGAFLGIQFNETGGALQGGATFVTPIPGEIPEPATFTFIGGGALLLGWAMRRRKTA